MVRIADRGQAKKLIEAAQHWAAGGKPRDQSRDDWLALTGIDVGLPADEAETDFLVFEENWPAVSLFCRLSTQWRVAPMGGFIGLDYTAVEATFRLLEVEDRPGMFACVQIMERSALEVFREKSD